jgi:hypothetical protein
MSQPPFDTWHTARKQHRCDGRRYDDCLYVIPAGARYRRGAIPPHWDGINGDHWWIMRLCVPCAGYFIGPADPLAVAS